jgi:hypothetical protein
MKIEFYKLPFLFSILLFAIIACSENKRDNNLYDRDLKISEDTARNYNPPSQVLKGGDSLVKTDTVKRDTSRLR